MSIKLVTCLLTFLCLQFNYSMSMTTTGEKLVALRQKMREKGYHAYIIPSEDEHQSEYTAKKDQQREWISGFTGSAGIAVVTLDKAALWSDSRYFIRGDKELNNTEWIFQKSGEPGVPTLNNWIITELNKTEKSVAAEYGKLVSITEWTSRETLFNRNNITFLNSETELVASIWTDRPSIPSSPIEIHDFKYAGESWKGKMNRTVMKLKESGADLVVITALDEVAWLFNLRSADIPYNPMLFSYAIVNLNGPPRLYINEERVTPQLRAHLDNTITRPYDSVTDDIKEFAKENKKIWISPQSSYAVYSAVIEINRGLLISQPSPIRTFKGVKNPTEIARARECHIRDSAARIKHMYWLENEIKNGTRITEVSSAAMLEKIQGEDPLFRSLSFDSISAVGAHAADIHFSTNEEEDQVIDKSRIYLLDAGAQYVDCTTDVTRTHHYGTPNRKEILAYTKVLQGSVDYADLVFPYDATSGLIDVQARASLWKSGLDYGHGTMHGIGFYLGVHESLGTPTYLPGMFQSDEPGYYENGFFGIRLETDIEVVEAKTTFETRKFMKFQAHTFVPFDRNLIDYDLLTKAQLQWLDEYYKNIREKVGPLLKDNREVYDYLFKSTEPVRLLKGSFSNQAHRNGLELGLFLVTSIIAIFNY